ncbi:hypothetical protein BDZ45DRAFT_441517 [Acephala macrosclerotiorum]|nr:hypothetical protein BDZ45DRAFT_441517 [Acephala macrosclerotiorum]
MASDSYPTIRVLITPRLNVSNAIAGLRVVLTIEAPRVEEDFVLVTSGTTVNQSFIPRQIEASDDAGTLRLETRISHSSVSWLVGRKTSGDVKLKYRTGPVPDTRPKVVSKATSLYIDQGGLISSGLSFLPTPPGDKNYRHIVEWDLSQTPNSTRAVWTFGEGPNPIEKVGPCSILTQSVYMVGPVQSNPPTPIPGTLSDYYGYYWFGELPPNVAIIKDMHHDFFLKVSEFFEETPSVDNPYRSFVLNTWPSKSLWGTSFLRSHIFAYDDQISEADDYDLVRRMAYEMSHLFLGPPVTTKDVDWLYEGIKNCLSIYMPFRNGFRTGHYFQATINTLCLRYYTHPLINLPLEGLLKLVPTSVSAREHLEARAWAFVVSTDLKIRRMSELKRPIEDLGMKPLAKLRAAGEPYGIEQWKALLEPLMGTEFTQRYEDFIAGRTILLIPELYGAKTHYLKQVDQELLDFGMDQKCFEYGLVMELKSGSRAEEAGLKEGDKILWSSHEWRCVDHFDVEMEVIVERDGEEMPIKYWPRTHEKVKSWQMIKKDEEGYIPPPAQK